MNVTQGDAGAVTSGKKFVRGKAPHPIDLHVGGRARLRRMALGMSQGALARRIGVSFQAVQKYETGGMRIAASRLYDVARALAVAPGFFFEGYEDEWQAMPAPGSSELGTASAAPETQSLLRSYRAIRDPELQAQVLRLVTTLAGGSDLGQARGGAPVPGVSPRSDAG